MTHYYAGRSGDPINEVHTDADCAAEDGPVRPIADETVESLDGVTYCSCTGKEPKDMTEELISEGVCPWCDEYSGEHVGQHASSAHPDRWDAFKGGD